MARRQEKSEWPAWFYGPSGESGVFERIEDVPVDWVSSVIQPGPEILIKPTQVLDRDELVAELTTRGVEINPIWGNAHMKRIIDGDISPTR